MRRRPGRNRRAPDPANREPECTTGVVPAETGAAGAPDTPEGIMNNVIYIVGLVVVVIAVLSLAGVV